MIKVLGLAVAFFALLYLLGCLPFFQVSEIAVEGTTALTVDKVISLSGIQTGDNFFYLDTWNAKKDLKAKSFLWKMSKSGACCPIKLPLSSQSGSQSVILSPPTDIFRLGEDGRLLAIQQTLSNYNLPVISGIDLSELPAIGGFIENEKLKQALEILQNCDQSLLDNIAELNVGQEYYILAYTNQKLEVRLGGLDNIEQRLQDLNGILTNGRNKNCVGPDFVHRYAV